MENGKTEVGYEEFEPLWDYILIDPIIQTKTRGGVALPDNIKVGVDDTQKGVVVKSGPGAYRDSGTFVPNPIKVGDMVFFMGMRAPFKVVLKGKSYLCMSGRDCVAIVPRKED